MEYYPRFTISGARPSEILRKKRTVHKMKSILHSLHQQVHLPMICMAPCQLCGFIPVYAGSGLYCERGACINGIPLYTPSYQIIPVENALLSSFIHANIPIIQVHTHLRCHPCIIVALKITQNHSGSS